MQAARVHKRKALAQLPQSSLQRWLQQHHLAAGAAISSSRQLKLRVSSLERLRLAMLDVNMASASRNLNEFRLQSSHRGSPCHLPYRKLPVSWLTLGCSSLGGAA